MSEETAFFISNFRCVLDVVCSLLGKYPVSEFYMPTFRNTLFHHHTYLPMKMEQTECSETSAYKIQTPGNYPEESIQQHWNKSLKTLNKECTVHLKYTKEELWYGNWINRIEI